MAQTSMNPVEPVSIIAINPFHSSWALGEKRSGGPRAAPRGPPHPLSPKAPNGKDTPIVPRHLVTCALNDDC